jgi:hypothetical protein
LRAVIFVGLMPIIEAVKGGDFATVDMLIHYGAYANVKEPKTGVTPLHVAHERGNAKVRCSSPRNTSRAVAACIADLMVLLCAARAAVDEVRRGPQRQGQ